MRRALVGFVLASLWPLLALPVASALAQAPSAIFLVSHKDMPDGNFRDTVVLVTNAAGPAPLGVIVNRRTHVPLSRVFPDLEGLASRPDARLYFGGPVARDRLLFVFRAAAPPKDSTPLMEGVYMSHSRELLLELLGRAEPLEGLRVFAGHSGWAPGQLEAEVARGSWHLAGADAESVFHERPEELWPALERAASVKRARLPAVP